MHGRPRKPQKPEEEEASAAEAAKLRPLQSQLLENHHQKNYDKEALEVSAKLLEMNPDLYTAWNYRKLAVEHYLKESSSDTDSIKAILNEELRVAENALRQNVKSYGAWYHRKWILSKGHSSTDHELRLLGKFQKLDARNFHAWNYRRFVAALMNIPEKTELKYTTDMIDTNFSNYSAWHNRSKIGKLTLARLLTAHAATSPHANKMVQLEEVLDLYQDLMKLDPSHFHYYKDEHSLVSLQKATSTRESLLRHCYCYKDQTSPYIGSTTCVRLNNLSISRIGSVEKLLWVQVLDLSHNELRSIEGRYDSVEVKESKIGSGWILI